jgi:hypothetical protein
MWLECGDRGCHMPAREIDENIRQYNEKPTEQWWRTWRDSNPRHPVPKTGALSAELQVHAKDCNAPIGLLRRRSGCMPATRQTL